MPGQVACRDVGRRRAGPMGLEGWWLVSYLPARRARSRRSPVTVQRWPCRGAPLVVSSAEGATRRSVTVSRDLDIVWLNCSMRFRSRFLPLSRQQTYTQSKVNQH